MTREKIKILSSSALKVIAMVCMLFDHAWATIVPGNMWMTVVGRIAFPIFAFQLVEGFFHTRDRKVYARRMFRFALVTELPFNLVAGGGWLYPFHQNVLFTFWLSLLILGRLERSRQRGKLAFGVSLAAWAAVGYLGGTLLMVDYYGYGILMVLVFYLARGLNWGWLVQLAGMYYINVEMMKGLVFPVELGSFSFDFPLQGFALLALIPIWLYNGEKGKYSKVIQPVCYWFYPVHLLILGLLGLYVI